MIQNPVRWFEIYVKDMNRAKTFYETVFQVKLEKLENGPVEMWIFPGAPDRSGSPGALVLMPKLATGNNSILIYFACDDCANQAERAVKAGGSIIQPKFHVGPYGDIAIIRDTEENMIGLHSQNMNQESCE